MSETELYGLMAVAKEHQEAAERHQKAAQAAIRDLRGVTQEAPRTFHTAATEALTGASTDLKQSVSASRQAIHEVTVTAQKNLRSVGLALLIAAFMSGAALASVAWGYFAWDKLDVLHEYSHAIYSEVKTPNK